jgi:HSP20 family protein
MVWDPFEELMDEIERMRRRMRRIFAEGFRIPRMELKTFPVDVLEENDEIVIRADIPGFKKDEISVRVLEDSVDIKAARKEKIEERKEGFYRAERRVGALRRRFSLPVTVKPETAKAKLENGVLEIRVKKVEEKKKGKEVKIE